MMYAKDHRVLAFTLRRLTDELQDRALSSRAHQMQLLHHTRVCTDIACALVHQNPKLSLSKFLEACGLNE